MTETEPARQLPARTMFVVWAAPERGTRSAWLAQELGVRDVKYVMPTRRRGLLAAPVKYPSQLIRMFAALARNRPRVVLVQSPPSFSAWAAVAYAFMTGASVVIDAHSDAFERSIWTRPGWLTRAVARRAAATLVTDEHWAARVRSWGAQAISVPSVPTQLQLGVAPPMPAGFNIAVVNTWQPDEPIAEILLAAEQLPDVTFHVTGRGDRIHSLSRLPPANVRFTGFLSQPDYHALLARSHAVMCLTTRDHTMQNGAAEALSLSVPIITSDWPILRAYFSAGTVHVDTSPDGIRDGVRRLLDSHATYRAEIEQLRMLRQNQWHAVRRTIVDSVLARLAGVEDARGPASP